MIAIEAGLNRVSIPCSALSFSFFALFGNSCRGRSLQKFPAAPVSFTMYIISAEETEFFSWGALILFVVPAQGRIIIRPYFSKEKGANIFFRLAIPGPS